MPTLTMSPTLGDLLKYELSANYCRETVTLKAGTSYALGAVLGKITATARYRLSPAAAVVGDEGAEVAVAVLIDPNIARDATYVAGGGETFLVRVIERRPDVVSEFAGGRIASATAVFDLRVSDVVAPRPGDRIEIDGEAYLVQGEPRRDAARLVWTLDTRPA